MLRNTLKKSLSNKDKKAEMSIQLVVGMAIALVVMIIVIIMFAGKMSWGGDKLQMCSTSAGRCAPIGDNCVPNDANGLREGTYEVYAGNYSDCGPTKNCCVRIGG